MVKHRAVRAVIGVASAVFATGLLLRGFVAAEDLLPESLAAHGAFRLDATSAAEGAKEVRHPWSVEVHRTAGTMWEGSIKTIGKDGVEEAIVRSEVSWPAVRGIVVAGSGEQVATFEGTISLTDGIKGELTTAAGETGTWWFNWP